MMMAFVQLWNKSITTVPAPVPLLLLRGLSSSRISQQQSRDYSSSGGPPISNDEVKALFEEWAMRCDRVYKTLKEKERRFKVFKKTLDEVKKHNFPCDSSFAPGLTYLSDWTPAERRACKLQPKRKRRADLQRAGAEAAESRQWRQQTNEVLRWLVAGQQEIYRRLEMQPHVSPLIPPSTQEVGTSTQQAGKSLQQPPLNDSQL